MNTALAKTPPAPQLASKPKALEMMATRLNLEPAKVLQVLKETVFKNASDNELAALVVVCNEYQLNPLLKEIYAFPAKGGGIVPVVSIDGWLAMVNRHPKCDGMEFDYTHDDEGHLVSVTCRLFRNDRTRPTVVTEYLSECKRNTEPWKMEHRMLRHKALKECARYAFGFSGVVDEDEAIDISATVIEDDPKQAKKGQRVIAAVPTKVVEAPAGDPHAELEAFLTEHGFSMNMLQLWGEESGNIENATQYATVQDIPVEIVARLMKAKPGLKAGLDLVKGGMGR